MPYRRLPNTDQARIRALKTAVGIGDVADIRCLPLSLNTLSEARNYVRKFEVAQNYYLQCLACQSSASQKHQLNVKTVRLYVSHFIQVLNMAVIRTEIKETYKKLYGLTGSDFSVPDLTCEVSIAEWGQKVIEGERKRMSQGGIPIYNPTIAKVKVHYDIFMDSYDKQKGLQALTARSLETLAAMRAQADALILDVWNQVETRFQDVVPNEARLAKCREYGLIYYYRKGEKPAEESFK